MRNVVVALLLLACAVPMFALRTADFEVVVPFVTNAPGAYGIVTQTNFHVVNRGTAGQWVSLTLHPYFGGTPITKYVYLAPHESKLAQDVVLTVFGLSSTTGQLIVRALGNSPVEARARYVRTIAATGESAEEPVVGIGKAHLRKEAFLYGLSGTGGNTVTLGVANPNAVTVKVTTRVSSSTGTLLYSRSDFVGANQNVTFGNIFAAWAIAPQDIQVELTTAGGEPIYGYGMELDDLTPEFEFEWGTSLN